MKRALFTIVPKGHFGLLKYISPYYPPLGIAYLAAVLERDGWEVEIFDGIHEHEKRLLKRVAEKRFHLIGVSAVMPLVNQAKTLARKLSKISPESLLVIGGPIASSVPEELVGPGFFHVAIRGEAEHVIGAIAEVAASEGSRTSIVAIPGAVTRQEDTIIESPPASPTYDLDSLPLPALHLLSKRALYMRHPMLPKNVRGTAIITSRGCPYRCSFCYRYPYKEIYRTHSPERVIEEIEYLSKRYGVKNVRFQDDTMTFNRERILRICELMLERLPGLTWDCTTRVDLVDETMLKIMARAGCRSITFGLESDNEKDHKMMRKEFARDPRETIEACNAVGILPVGHFIIGFPWDTPMTIKERIRYARSLPLAAALFWPFYPWPNTPVYDEIETVQHQINMDRNAITRATFFASMTVNLSPSRLSRILRRRVSTL